MHSIIILGLKRLGAYGLSLVLQSGKLLVASAFPDPPFDIEGGGFDADLMKEICKRLNLEFVQLKFKGDNFNDIFLGLQKKEYDAVISGTTITPERSQIVLFSDPYLEFNQGIAVNTKLTPNVRTLEDLNGLVAGIQKGNTSDKVAKELLAKKIISDVKYYAYKEIELALKDLEAGNVGLIIKLYPVLQNFILNYPTLSVVLQVPTHEKLGIAFSKDNNKLQRSVSSILFQLSKDGTLEQLKGKWLLIG